jgi:hypothetical protein
MRVEKKHWNGENASIEYLHRDRNGKLSGSALPGGHKKRC